MYNISQYKVEDQPIGEGGMGRILRGYAPDGTEVAIKEILPEFAADIEMRFRISQEMRFMERLEHKSIVKTIETFMLLDKYYIVMELVHGLNLEQWINAKGVFPERFALSVMISVLDVMQFVHEKQIVHRDLKPSNIMIRDNGEICLLDFGIAKDMSAGGSKTQYGSVIGSDGYMSPEQAMGLDIDYRSDIYALGCVLYFMLTGTHAFPSTASEAEMLVNITDKPFPKVTAKNKSVSKRLQDAIFRATDKNMMRRYQSCAEFANELRNILSPGSAPKSAGTSVSASKNNGRVYITLGREGCDLIFDDPNNRVSRHHAEIELKSFTGGSFYIFRDDSSNGSLVNNAVVHHMKYHIPCEGPLPEIYLAGDPAHRVDWNVVIPMLEERKKMMDQQVAVGPPPPPQPQPQPGDIGSGVAPGPVPPGPVPPGGQGIADMPQPQPFNQPRKMFAAPFSFSGRIRRLEYGLSVIISSIIIYLLELGIVFASYNENEFLAIVLALLLIPIIWFNLAQGAKRCHDRDNSGWFMLIPFYGFWMLFADGDPYENRFGPDPKGRNFQTSQFY